ncbi:accessory gene regulator B family protein [Paenibacillus rhizophilus]|uniref:Accessory regulator AgrB n=1 Tax=Paenibacillus rhizophilus TaxID=1850366 RepID=A0A3N9P6Q7_9BACL|nr:accessory gene regulator B family protein [Paenibacillus rhizophilus]RQW11878.1 accessory regulator AgrB [Paenibacillus rhizophilus]
MILEELSRRIAKKIKKYDPEGPGSLEVLGYGIGIKLNLYSGILLTVLFGLLFSSVLHSLLALASFMVLRKFSGGYHLPITLCSLVTGLTASLVPLISLGQEGTILLTALSLLIALAFAPNNYEELYNVEFDSWSKGISVLIIASNLYFQSAIVAVSFMIQSLLLLPTYPRKGGVNL